MDDTARWVVTSSDELLGDAGSNTPFEVALVETEDGGAVAQVLGAPDEDVTWLEYALTQGLSNDIPVWQARRDGEAWYRSLETVDSDALLEAINAAVVFAAGLFVVSVASGWPVPTPVPPAVPSKLTSTSCGALRGCCSGAG